MNKLRSKKTLAVLASVSLAACSSSSGAPAAATVDPCAGVDTQSDASNCGVCGHDCQGGDCQAGICQPIVLATKQDSPRTLLLDSANVYVSSESHESFYSLAIDAANLYSGVQGLSTWSIDAVPLNGDSEVVIAANQAMPHSIVSDDTNVYWTNFVANGSVMMAPASGGAATTLASTTGSPAGLALDANNLYYADYQLGTINKVPLDKSAPSVIVSGLTAPEPIAVDDTCVYWASNDGTKTGRIMKVAK